MKYKTKHLKRFARYDLSGKLGIAIGGSVIVVLASFVSGMLTGPLFSGSNLFSYVMQDALDLVVSIILGIFSAGLTYLFLNMARRREYSLKDLIWFFHHQPDRVLIASLVFSLIAFVTGLPSEIYGKVYFPMVVTEEELMNVVKVYAALSMGGMLLSSLLTIPVAFAYNILADDEEISGFEALRKSMKMMKGNIRRFIFLELSFLPWLIISFYCLYIPLLFVIPYLNMTETEFYLDLTGELEVMHNGGTGPVATSFYSDEHWS